jgi:DNA gyrase subunit A
MAVKKKKNGLDVNQLIANENLISTPVTDEIEDAMLTYAIKTIIDRAIPEVRDGMKPVQRRILYGAYEGKYLPDRKYVKNARIVGDVMGNYHPHGDGSIYSALTAMSQPWNYRYPLIDFQGNNGSYDGDDAAAMRYTEGRLDKKALTLLNDLDAKSVDFKPNYAETTEEPEVLPGLFPNLLLNGASGIATGYTTDIPSHQLGEVVDGIIELIKNPKAELDDIMQHIKGPDFAGGAYLVKNNAIRELYSSGKGSLQFKAKYEVEKHEESDNFQIVFTELPPQTNKPKLHEKLHELCIDKKVVPRVIDVRDESDGNKIRLVVELHKTGVPDIVINELYDKTPLQRNMTFIMRAIVNKTPKVLTLKEILEHYIEHRRDVVTRRTEFSLEQNRDKLHIQEGLKIVTDDIDKAIEIIKDSDEPEDAKAELMNYFKLSDKQAAQVLDIRLRQLTKLNKKDLEALINELKAEIAKLENILSGQVELDKVIVSELKWLKNTFNDERRTILIGETEAKKLDTVSGENAEPIALVLTSKNTVKHITLRALDDMFKNGLLKERNEIFIQGVKCKIDDEFILILNTGEYVKIEFSDLTSGLTCLNDKAQIKAIVIYDKSSPNKMLVTMTKQGIVKKVTMDGFSARLRRVAPFLQLQDGDEILAVRVINSNKDNIITIATKEGLVHRFFEQSFKETAAGGKGIDGIKLADKDEVVDFNITSQVDDEKSKIVLYCKHDDGTFGMKSMNLGEFKPKGRISQGIKGIEFIKKQPGQVTNLEICSGDFFVVDNKGCVVIQRFVKLPEHNRYNKAEPIIYEVATTKFFLE